LKSLPRLSSSSGQRICRNSKWKALQGRFEIMG
jgi:hypothetical protein